MNKYERYKDGVLVEYQEYTSEELATKANGQIMTNILRLEAEAAQPRRIREAILGIDNGWLANQESLIAIERNKLGE